MKVRNFKYYIREALKSIFKNRLMSLASIITVASCIFILVFSYCIVSNVGYLLDNVESSLDISVYIDNKITEKELKYLKQYITNLKDVESVSYISSEDALKIFSDSLGDMSSDFVAGLENKNILPASFTIKVNDIANQQSVIKQLEKLIGKGIVEVKYDEEVLDNLIVINNTVGIISVVIILFLAMLSTIIIVNTIKLTVNNRKNEINIMKYVGATDSFIRWPFIIEGVLIGIIGSLITVVISFFLYNKSIEFIYSNMAFIRNWLNFRNVKDVFKFIGPISILLGILIGIVGSITSIRKHLQV